MNGCFGISGEHNYHVSPLFIAAQAGHMDIVELLLQKKDARTDCFPKLGRLNQILLGRRAVYHEEVAKMVSEKTSTNNCFLCVAARLGNEELVCALLEAGVDINQLDKLGRTPLYLAAKWNHVNVVKLLLERTAEIDRTAVDGNTALHEAAANGHEIVDLLLKAGAKIFAAHNGRMPLHVAARYGQLKAVESCLKARADDLNALDINGASPLFMAAEKGHTEVVRLLLSAGADKYKLVNGVSLVAITSSNRHKKVVDLLQS